MSVLYEFGEFGPIILIFVSWYLLWTNHNLFFYYNVGIFANAILNLILKGIIQEPRPLFDNKKIHLMKVNLKHFFYNDGIPFNIFGMPSGHAQTAFFITVFIYLSLKKNNIFYFFLLYSLFICYQRVKTEYHSIPQVVVGAFVGSAFGYFMYNLAREKIKGKIREKPDDFGPV
jgi:membrane-associated phospholipid phosphatase